MCTTEPSQRVFQDKERSEVRSSKMDVASEAMRHKQQKFNPNHSAGGAHPPDLLQQTAAGWLLAAVSPTQPDAGDLNKIHPLRFIFLANNCMATQSTGSLGESWNVHARTCGGVFTQRVHVLSVAF